MTIGIDIRVLGSGVHSGVEEYAERLLAHLIPLDPAIRFKLFSSSFRGTLPDYPWLHAPNVEVHKFRIPNKALFLGAKFANVPALDTLVGGAETFFFPHFFLAPLSAACKRVTTFHDLSYEAFPEFFPLPKRLWHRFMNPAWQARMSDRVIAVSESTKQDVARVFRIDPAKIDTVLSGVTPQARWSRTQLDDFRREHHLFSRFIFFISTIEPRKNLCGLIEAFDQLASRPEYADVELVIAGRMGWLWQDARARAQRSPHQRRIRFLGRVAGDPAGFYQLASLCVYPSFLEGFGFPLLEAMACGVPVITSATSSMPEVAGRAALLVNPYDVRQLADAMAHALSDTHLREELVTRGAQRVRELSWNACAEKTLEVLTRA